MSHASKINVLTEELVGLITGFSPTNNAAAYRSCKDAASRNLKQHRHGRTNQFNVQASLEGLIEKLRILNNDSVAEALEARLKETGSDDTSHMPEILSLFLSLSDKPVEKSKVEDLERLKPPTPPPPLTWDEILQDDPLTERGIWDHVDYRGASSDEGSVSPIAIASSEDDASSSVSGSVDETHALDPHSLVITVDESSLAHIAKGQAWRWSTEPLVELEEPQLVREVLHALRGLPSDIFEDIPGRVLATPRRGFLVANCSESAINSVLQCLGVIASNLNSLRRITKRRTSKPLLQAFSAHVEAELRDFERRLAGVEGSLARPEGPVIASILNVQIEVESLTPFLLRLNTVITKIEDEIFTRSYRLLDHLFSEACDAQMEGDESMFQKFATIFLSCLNEYIRPVHQWMEAGETEDLPDTFLIRMRDHKQDLSAFWHERYEICHDNNEIQAPAFLHDFLPEIFAAGKVIALLKELGLAHQLYIPRHPPLPPLNFSSIFTTDLSLTLVPFSSTIHTSLCTWLVSKQAHTWPLLCTHLTTKCRFYETLEALQTIYLSKNGALFTSLTSIINNSLTSPTLINSLRATLADHPPIVPRQLSTTLNHTLLRKKGLRRTEALTMTYAIPTILANIIPPTSLSIYNSAAHLLTQLTHARTTLSSIRLRTIDSKAMLVLSLRHRLLHFLTTVLEHVTQRIHAAARTLTQSLDAAKEFDETITAHDRFMAAVSWSALLVPETKTARESVRSICDVAVAFAGRVSAAAEDSGTSVDLRQTNGHLRELVRIFIGNLRGAARSAGEDGGQGWAYLVEVVDWTPEREEWVP